MSRAARAVVLVSIVFVGLPLAGGRGPGLVAAAPSRSPAPDNALAEGHWKLVLDGRLDTVHEGASGTSASAASLSGDGEFDVGRGGDVTGAYDISGFISAIGATSTATGDGFLSLAGSSQPIIGTRNAPVLSGQVVVEGTIVVHILSSTVETPVSVPGPIGGSGDAPLEVQFSDCDVASGDWSPAVKESSAAAGNVTTGVATWTAYRVSDLDARLGSTSRFFDDLFAYQTDLEQFENAAVSTHTVDTTNLATLLERAETLNAEIPLLEGCAALSDSSAANVLARAFRTFLSTMVRLGGRLSTDDLVALVSTAYRVGAIGGAAGSDPGAPELEAKLQDAVATALDAAVAAHDVDAITEIGVLANQAGWSDLQAQAARAL
jgi:hypothetical protein